MTDIIERKPHWSSYFPPLPPTPMAREPRKKITEYTTTYYGEERRCYSGDTWTLDELFPGVDKNDKTLNIKVIAMNRFADDEFYIQGVRIIESEVENKEYTAELKRYEIDKKEDARALEAHKRDLLEWQEWRRQVEANETAEAIAAAWELLKKHGEL